MYAFKELQELEKFEERLKAFNNLLNDKSVNVEVYAKAGLYFAGDGIRSLLRRYSV